MMKIARIAILIVMMFAGIELCMAQDYTDMHFSMFNEKGRQINDSIIHLEISPVGSNISQRYDKYITDGTLDLRVVNGRYLIKFFVREGDRNFFNYYAEQEIDTNLAENESVTLMPIAHVSLMIVDKHNNIITDAILKFDCPGNSVNNRYNIDAFGSFSFNNIYFGRCRIYANSDDNIGVIDIDINESRIYDVRITLEPRSSNILLYIVILIIILSATIWIISRLGRIKDRKSSKEPVKKVKGEIKEIVKVSRNSDSGKLEAVMKTLDQYEKEVVRYLMEHDGASTQGNIRNHTSIPKTSLFRCIYRLEKKQIVRTESIGKMKRVILNRL